MERKDNQIKVHVQNSTGGLHISAPSVKQAISATNNRAQYFADLAKKYKDEAKKFRDDALYYAQQNSDVTVEYVESIRMALENEINEQCINIKTEMQTKIPTDVSELNNDVPYIKKNDFDKAVNDLELPSQSNCEGMFLYTDGEKESWKEFPSSFCLFDVSIKDHILTYEESKGWALQGTYVYKDAIAGSRYGYPDFYNKVVEEYNASTVEYITRDFVQPVLTANGTMGGASFAVKASAEHSTYSAYLAFDNNTSTFWIPINASNPEGQYCTIYNPKALNVTKIQITNRALAGVTITSGIVYGSNNNSNWTKLTTFENTSTESGAVWNINLSNNTGFYNYYKLHITAGGYGTNSSLSIAEISLTAKEALAKVKKNSNGHIFYDISEKSNVDTVFSQYGSAWFYGVDTVNKRIFLPRNKYFAIGSLTEAPVGGDGKSLGLMAVNTLGQPLSASNSKTFGLILDNGSSHNYEMFRIGAYNVPLSTTATGSTVAAPDNAPIGVTTDANASGLVANLSEAIKSDENKYLYICVGNTESQSAITNVVDVTTTENDTIPLFTGMYFDFTPNNASWLKAGQQANSGGIYKTCYNELVNVLNGKTKYGSLKVVDSSKMTAGIDYSEYWKVNQTAMTFTTPSKISYLPINSDTAPVIGNGMALGLTNGTKNYGLGSFASGTNIYRLGGFTPDYGKKLPNSTDSGVVANSVGNNEVLGIAIEPTKSGIVADLLSAKSSTAQLYFKVANVVQNIELLDVGEVLDVVSDKISYQDCKAYITETYVSGTSWYRVYSDGWCEQGGHIASGTVEGIVTLLKPYVNTNYDVIVAPSATGNNFTTNIAGWANSKIQFNWNSYNNSATPKIWRTYGYIN